MESEDVINLPPSSPSGFQEESNEVHDFDSEPGQANFQPSDSEKKDDELKGDKVELNEHNAGIEDGQIIEQEEVDMDVGDDSPIVQVNVEVTRTIVESDPRIHVQNGCLEVQNWSTNHKTDVSSISGVKRARMTFEEDQPSVRVIYNSLTRASKQKLEELLQQWSEWQAQHGSSSNDPNEVIESGEETYFPAISVGTQKGPAVSFWIDNETKNQHDKGFIPVDSNSIPLYDRGYALGLTFGDGSNNLEGGLEIVDEASRCFNCGSYSHSLKECPKPRDNVAVNKARKQHKFKRNQSSASRNPTRYYQNSAGGKYDGLRPGALDIETRQHLGLGELDPPPWLNRMRELGYPPGYLEDEDLPSGITIYADGEVREDTEDGEIIEKDRPESKRKMTVEFPGVNAPIPENADERLWVARPSSSVPSRDRSHHRSIPYSGSVSRGHYHEERWSRDFRDDGPPGVDPVSSYPSRHGGLDYYSSHRSPPHSRSQSDRSRSSLVVDDYVTHGSYSSRYSSDRRMSSPDYGLDGYRNDHNHNYLSRSVEYDRILDEYNRYRPRSSRW